MAAINIPSSINFSGTVSAPAFVSNQVLIAPVAFGTTSTLSVGNVSATILNVTGTIMGNVGSITQAYASTLSVGTILNFSAGGSIGTNLALSGTFTAPVGSISSSIYAATLSIGTILNFLQGQTVSTGGTASGTYSSGTLTFQMGGSFSGTLTAPAVGINTSSPAYPLDINGNVRNIGNYFLQASTPSLYIGPAQATTQCGYINFANTTTLSMQLGIFGVVGSGITITPSGNTGINNSTPAYPLDISGYMRTGNRSVSFKYVYGNGVSMASGSNLLSFTNYDSSFPYTTITNGHFVCPVSGLYLFSFSLGMDFQSTTSGGYADLFMSRSASALTSAPAQASNTAVFSAIEIAAMPAYSVQRISCVTFCNSGDHIQAFYASANAFKSYTWSNSGAVNYMTGILISAS